LRSLRLCGENENKIKSNKSLYTKDGLK